MKVIQHIPGFIDVGASRFEGDIGSLPELTQLKWVQKFWEASGFYQFVRTPDAIGGYLLMAEFDGGKRYYVVARMQGDDVTHLTRGLPDWKAPEQ